MGPRYAKIVTSQPVQEFLLKFCLSDVPVHCAATSAEEQKYVEEKFFPYIGEVLTHGEFLKRLE